MTEKIREKERSDTLDVEDLISELGSFGRFQLKNLVVLFMPVLLTGLFTISYVFTADIQNYRCFIPECESLNETTYKPSWLPNAVPYDSNGVPKRCLRYVPKSSLGDDGQCSGDLFITDRTERCDKFIFEDDHTTIVNDFGLYCEENFWKMTFVGTIHNVGQFFAMPMAGAFSDRYGRRTALIWGLVLSSMCGLLRSISPTYVFFVSMEFLDALFGAATYASAFVLCMELVDAKKRILCSTIVCSAYSFGEAIIGFAAWHALTWQKLLQYTYLPGFLIIGYYWIVPESLKWLLVMRRYREFERVVINAAKFNRVTLADETLNKMRQLKEEKAKEKEKLGQVEKTTKTNDIKLQTLSPTIVKDAIADEHPIRDICCSCRMVFRVIICSICWITCAFVYYGLSLHSVALSGHKYANFIAVSLVEVPGYAFNYLCMDRIGRKASLGGSFIVTGLACLLFIFYNDGPAWLQVSLFLMGKCAITMSFACVYVFTAELYPTAVRQSLMGFCSMIGRIGSIVAPQMPLLAVIWTQLPMVCFGATAVVSGFLVMLLPETLNTKLPDTVQDAINLGRKHDSENVEK